MPYFMRKEFLVGAIEHFADSAANAALTVVTLDVFSVVDLDSWAGVGQAALVGGLVAVLTKLKQVGPVDN